MFQEINAARKLLELPEHATMEEIKANYRAIVQKWHPDRCEGDKERCKEMTVRIIAAYRLINDYCRSYKFSFSKEEVSRYVSVEDMVV
jgi:DnaJ-class molecular chaperone